MQTKQGGDTFVYQTEPRIEIRYATRQIESKEISPYGKDLLLTQDEIKAREDDLWYRKRYGATVLYKCEKGLDEKECKLLTEVARKVAQIVKSRGLAGRSIDTYYPINVRINNCNRCAEFKVRCYNDYDEDHAQWYIAEPAEDSLNELFHGEVNIGVSAGDKKWFYVSVYKGDNWGSYCKMH